MQHHEVGSVAEPMATSEAVCDQPVSGRAESEFLESLAASVLDDTLSSAEKGNTGGWDMEMPTLPPVLPLHGIPPTRLLVVQRV